MASSFVSEDLDPLGVVAHHEPVGILYLIGKLADLVLVEHEFDISALPEIPVPDVCYDLMCDVVADNFALAFFDKLHDLTQANAVGEEEIEIQLSSGLIRIKAETDGLGALVDGDRLHAATLLNIVEIHHLSWEARRADVRIKRLKALNTALHHRPVLVEVTDNVGPSLVAARLDLYQNASGIILGIDGIDELVVLALLITERSLCHYDIGLVGNNAESFWDSRGKFGRDNLEFCKENRFADLADVADDWFIRHILKVLHCIPPSLRVAIAQKFFTAVSISKRNKECALDLDLAEILEETIESVAEFQLSLAGIDLANFKLRGEVI